MKLRYLVFSLLLSVTFLTSCSDEGSSGEENMSTEEEGDIDTDNPQETEELNGLPSFIALAQISGMNRDIIQDSFNQDSQSFDRYSFLNDTGLGSLTGNFLSFNQTGMSAWDLGNATIKIKHYDAQTFQEYDVSLFPNGNLEYFDFNEDFLVSLNQNSNESILTVLNKTTLDLDAIELSSSLTDYMITMALDEDRLVLGRNDDTNQLILEVYNLTQIQLLGEVNTGLNISSVQADEFRIFDNILFLTTIAGTYTMNLNDLSFEERVEFSNEKPYFKTRVGDDLFYYNFNNAYTLNQYNLNSGTKREINVLSVKEAVENQYPDLGLPDFLNNANVSYKEQEDVWLLNFRFQNNTAQQFVLITVKVDWNGEILSSLQSTFPYVESANVNQVIF